MKTKKLIVSILIFLTIVIVAIFTNQVNAASLGYITTSKDRTEDNITYKHQLYSNNTAEAKNIWKLVTSNAVGTPTNTIPDLYCLRAGLGFTSANPNHTTVEYNHSYDLPRQYNDLVTYFSTLQSKTNIFDLNKKANFNALIWILDNMLLEGADEAELNTYLKTYAGYTDEILNKAEKNVLSRADVEAIQQLAIWYFTNSDEAAYNKETLPTLYMSVTGDRIYDTNGRYETFADIYDLMDIGAFGEERQRAADTLYRNLIKNAKEKTADGTYNGKVSREITVYLAGTEAANEQPIVRVEEAGEVDIALRKFISQVEDTKYDRAPIVDTSNLNKVIDKVIDGETKKVLQTTAEYYHTKEPLKVSIGNIVTYTIRLYNEGDTDLFITEVTDYLPKHLQYAAAGEDSQGAGWQLNGNVAKTTEFCKVTGVGGNIQETEIGKNLKDVIIPAAEYDEMTEKYILSYVDIQISCKVLSTIPYDTNATNIAQVTKMMRRNGTEITADRDSTANDYLTLPEEDKLPDYTGGENKKNDPHYDGTNAVEGTDGKKYYPGQEDDDDFEKILVETPTIDLALRKFISQIGETKYNRAPVVDTSGLRQNATTAIYNHSKEPIQVEIGDIVTYTIRLYNEGPVDARVSKVTDYLDKTLKYVAGGNDKDASWWTETEGEKYTTLTSTNNCVVVNVGGQTDKASIGKKLGDVIIPAYDKTKDILSYIDIEVHCEVLPIERTRKLTNIAEITGQTDEYGTPIDKDRDSKPDYLPDGLPEDFPGYKDNEIDKPYVPGQQDDDDFEKVVVKPKFDLALRKFITKVGNTDINNRYPQVSYENGKLKYTHTKEPLLVATKDIVTYTIRVYNENEADGYANEITDDIPEGLEFLPENETNTTYRWKMLDENQEETDDVSKAKYLITDYLSEEQEKETGRSNLIKAFNKDGEINDTNPNWKEVKIAFKVTYVAKTKDDTERTIINTAQISKDSDDDIDSEPKRDEVYDHEDEEKNEDDIDYDQVKVKYFDLSLLKWVDKTMVTLNGKTTEIPSGHTAETSKNENPVKLELKASQIKKAVVKYSYIIRITNEGELEGYAKEIKDYVPEGLRFVKEDNPDWYETEDGQIATKALENTLLKPGESAEVKIILTWINKNDNFGEKVNLAEISKDYNESDSPDVDSTPDNEVPNEDDIDDAPSIIAVKTGNAQIYVGLILIILVTFAGGVGLIKKYVLE